MTADAPFIYFDGVGASGMTEDGIAVITLEASMILSDAQSRPVAARTVTAHLRMGRQALASLREALVRIEAGQPKIKN